MAALNVIAYSAVLLIFVMFAVMVAAPVSAGVL
jgi:hypothetical protein